MDHQSTAASNAGSDPGSAVAQSESPSRAAMLAEYVHVTPTNGTPAPNADSANTSPSHKSIVKAAIEAAATADAIGDADAATQTAASELPPFAIKAQLAQMLKGGVIMGQIILPRAVCM